MLCGRGRTRRIHAVIWMGDTVQLTIVRRLHVRRGGVMGMGHVWLLEGGRRMLLLLLLG